MMMLFLQQGGYAQQFDPNEIRVPPKLPGCKSRVFHEGPGAISSREWRGKRQPKAFLPAQNKTVDGVLNSCFGTSTFGKTLTDSTTILGKRYEDTNELAGIELQTLACKRLARRKGIAYYTIMDENFPLVSEEAGDTPYVDRLRRFGPANRTIRVAWNHRFSRKIKRSSKGFGKGLLSFYCFADGEGTFQTLEDAKAATASERTKTGLRGKVNFNYWPSRRGCKSNGGPWYMIDYINSAAEIPTPNDMCVTQVVETKVGVTILDIVG